MSTNFRVYVGTGGVADSTLKDIDTIAGEVCNGYTKYNANGGWLSMSNNLVVESCIVYEFISAYLTRVHAFANTAKTLTNQDAILITKQEVEMFIV